MPSHVLGEVCGCCWQLRSSEHFGEWVEAAIAAEGVPRAVRALIAGKRGEGRGSGMREGGRGMRGGGQGGRGRGLG